MKNEFIGHFKRSAEEVGNIWKEANFVLDANVLLNLYRYSKDTRNDFLSLFDNVKDRIWLPEQVGYEFLNNRSRVICEQSKAYAEAISSVKELSKSFSEERAHPFISLKVKTQYDTAAKTIIDEMNKNQKAQDELLTEDTILDKVADLFKGKVGAAYSPNEMEEAFKEGVKRYGENTPPGYKDAKKFKNPQNDAEKRSNFGDWILWKQLMDFSKIRKTPVIFVTNDTKEDWWLEQSGKTLGPRPELIAEFYAETEQHILIYKPERFLELGNENLKATIGKESITEVKTERKAREQHREEHLLSQDQSSLRRRRSRRRKNGEGEILFSKKTDQLPEEIQKRLFEVKYDEMAYHHMGVIRAKLEDVEHVLDRLFSSLAEEEDEDEDEDRSSEIWEQILKANREKEDLNERMQKLLVR